MPTISSPQFTRSTSPQARPLREFSAIGDDEHDLPEQQNDVNRATESLKQARQAKLNPPITASAKKRLEFLADIGKITKDVEIGGVIFSLRTLKSKELQQAYVAMSSKNTQIEAAFEFRRYCLAVSLSHIDHQDLETMLNVQSLEDRLNLIDDQEESTVETLFKAYNDMTNSTNEKFSIKSPQDVKEVAEDLKK